MYIPEYFRIPDRATSLAFMRANPFAILISATDDGPFATHVPVAMRETGDHIVVRGHVAKANPHWRHLEREPRCLMIFHGPHAYIAASNYPARENVPTWNYTAVHAYGDALLFSAPEQLQQVLHELIRSFEPPYAEQWDGLSDAYRDGLLSQIVGFEIAISRIETKFKLSQNRTGEEQENVISSLGKSTDSAVSGVARLMQERGLGEKK